ncbi:MAG: hypothetical protein KC414_06845, partial [Romboutsia sp.]|nr:hypothetical protein [Romboutsia sp.]
MISSFSQNLAPSQLEVNEWILTPDGALVKSNAKKLHKDMDKSDITDYLPFDEEQQSYIFSNDPKMKIKKSLVEGDKGSYGLEYFEYIEGKNNKPPKFISYDQFFTGKENTPAELIKNIAKKYPIYDKFTHIDNPFILNANELNKENRAKPIAITMQLNDLMKPDDDENPYQLESISTGSEEESNNVDQYKWGGKQKIPQYQWGSAVNGLTSGLGAGAAFGPVGMGVGALIGGVSGLIGGNKAKKAEQLNTINNAEQLLLDEKNNNRNN